MIEREPPKLALWLLEHCGPGYHRESLAGDLIEQCREGRSAAWCWGQVAAAVFAGRVRAIRRVPWSAACAMLSRLIAEAAAVLALAVIVDHARRTHSAPPMTQSFAVTVALLITLAIAAVLFSIRSSRGRRTHAAINAMMLAFGVIALGLGTITWADTLRGHEDASPVCRSK